jgi:hypothetical protein
MIVWKGLGYLIAIIGFGLLVATEMVVVPHPLINVINYMLELTF